MTAFGGKIICGRKMKSNYLSLKSLDSDGECPNNFEICEGSNG